MDRPKDIRQGPSIYLSQREYFRAMDRICSTPLTENEQLWLD
jgi:hypothetical protein